jgi:predicted aspartyl protease
MIRGFVNSENQAVIRLIIYGKNDEELETEAIVDTGFNGALGLPSSYILQLKLPLAGEAQSELADGRKRWFDLYEGTVMWDH